MREALHLLEQARKAADSGKQAKARKFYNNAARAAGNHAGILKEWGVFEAQAGNMSAARQRLTHARKQAPSDPDILFNLGQVERHENNWPAAADLFRQAFAADSTHGDAAFGVAEAMAAQQDHAGAVDWANRTLSLQPRDVEALMLKAGSLRELNDAREAALTYRQVLALNPDSAEAKINLARCLQNDNELDEAVELVNELEAGGHLSGPIYVATASIHMLDGNHAKANELADKAIALDEDREAASLIKIRAAIWTGDFDLAERLLKSVLDENPLCGSAYQLLAQIHRLPTDSRDNLEKIRADAGAGGDENQMDACFALYSLYRRIGLNDEAFDALSNANRISHALSDFNAARHHQAAERTFDSLTQSLFQQHQGEAFQGEGAIYIIGMPRSGTTLTEQILASYDSVHAGGERRDVSVLRSRITGYPERLREASADQLGDWGKHLHARLFADASGHALATDKLPGNYAFAGLIKLILPKAKLVYCKRHPQDNALSIFEQNFGSNLPYASDLEAIAAVFSIHLKYMEHWKSIGIDYHTVNYADLVSDPEPHARALVEYIGLDWDPRCLDTSGVERTVTTASQWQVRQPINSKSVGRWRQFEKQLQPFTRALENSS